MEHKKVTPEEIKEMNKIRNEIDSPKKESKTLPLIKNIYTKDGKKISQYKINIPKGFSDFLNLDKENFKIFSELDKENGTLVFEVIKNA